MKIVEIPDDNELKVSHKRTKKEKPKEDFSTNQKTYDVIPQGGSSAYTMTNKHLARRYSSERNLDALIDWDLKEGNCYHIISQGDIDSITFLRHIIRIQKVPTVYLSTWCMALGDIIEIQNWVNQGRIGHVVFCLGEIFKNTYSGEYEYLKKIAQTGKFSITIFRNHSKVMAGHGDKFPFVIESSANVNTNPRCENTVITIDKELTDFYINFYSNINSFE